MKNDNPKYDLEDYVYFENKVYRVRGIYCLSTGNSYTFVYSIFLVGNKNHLEKFKLIVEDELKKPTKKQLNTWNYLYGLG
jgi:hypothetical protein